eukprot:SAG11_NODE_11231_length_775_cov_0.785503_1_plen_81_part_10
MMAFLSRKLRAGPLNHTQTAALQQLCRYAQVPWAMGYSGTNATTASICALTSASETFEQESDSSPQLQALAVSDPAQTLSN